MSEFRHLHRRADTPGSRLHWERPFRVYTVRQLHEIEALRRLTRAQRFDMQVVATVVPFRVNQYVIDELIDWDAVPDDPMFRLTFPQPEMLDPVHFERVAALLRNGADSRELSEVVAGIHGEMNPHPADQQTLNVPELNGVRLEGMQHKYRETLLFFPSQGQTCHTYCTFCFRWPQFVGEKALRMSAREGSDLRQYLRANPEITDLLVTGGDPLVMKTAHLAAILEPLLEPGLEHVQSIRIGTKALTYWPYRVLAQPEGDALLRLLARLVDAGRHLALMAHIDHWRELEPEPVQEAIRRIQSTGAVVRTQAPLLAHINDDAEVWSRMWTTQIRLGLVPYYMFVERNTGPQRYFRVPLGRAWQVYQGAATQLSGLARTARGPSMSAGPGKVEVQGVSEIQGEKVFVLRFIQGRNPDWSYRPFFARYDPKAVWLNELRPAFGEQRFFFEDEYEAMCAAASDQE